MKINLGCGELPLPGYVNVDSHCVGADVLGDALEMVFVNADEVRMDHMLEHLPHGKTVGMLRKAYEWLKPGGKVVVEVPDMQAIMANPPAEWVTWVYGVQTHPGEFHQTGFTRVSLEAALRSAGFHDVQAEAFVSEHRMRPGMPCLVGTGVRP